MNKHFAKVLRELRTENNYSQQKLAERLFVDRSTVASWETGRRIPDAVLIARICDLFDVDPGRLLGTENTAGEKPVVIMVDDEKIILTGEISVLEKALPDAEIVGFTRASEAIEFAHEAKVAVAFLDIEMGMTSGLDVCRELLDINPEMNVIFLTAYPEYSLDAWSTGASGFVVKPLSISELTTQLQRLRHPVRGLSIG